MMKKPDEIKKGLELCSVGFYENICTDCPYSSLAMAECPTKLKADALAYIQQLEAERDAAVEDIRFAYTSYVGACQTCKHGKAQVDCIEPLRCDNCENEKCKCQSCDSNYSNWEWRGVQKEETK